MEKVIVINIIHTIKIINKNIINKKEGMENEIYN